ncbi:MAG: hypothetical protein LBL39_01735 [Planctomycetaceae bacterium]|jgi:hypothetical protein|nr:hypothetical protein [Planctomycetaceae bacterium]
MKKTDQMLSFFNAEVNVNIDFAANVNLGKQGGGGGQYVKSETQIFVPILRIIVTIILLGFLLNLVLVFLVSLWLSFWWLLRSSVF